ncbi:MAG TPA: efflux RND transporter periplasmic adaptor subunit [Enhygromyxa sp.]|nr:efflux RND transporter periplasmic adaptor subunit [Enhygromyxa sp.]
MGLLASGCDRQAPAASPEVETEPPAPIEARVRVRVEPASTAPLGDAGELTGIVEPHAQVIIAAETNARVTARLIERGVRVEAEQRLFELDGSRAWIEYQRAQASVEARQTDTAQAERERSRSSTLHEREGISAAAHDRSIHASEAAASAEELARLSKRAAARGLRDSKIEAPFAGTIAEYHVELGDFVRVGTPVATLVDLSRVRVRVGLTAAELALVQIGDRFEVEFADLGGRSLSAELKSVSPLADPRTGTYAAELWLDNPEQSLRQGMIGRVELGGEQARDGDALTIPRAAVIRRERGYAVWVIDEADGQPRVRARTLTLGRSGAERVAVLDGLAPGDRVVTEGMFALREGAAVEIENQP